MVNVQEVTERVCFDIGYKCYTLTYRNVGKYRNCRGSAHIPDIPYIGLCVTCRQTSSSCFYMQ